MPEAPPESRRRRVIATAQDRLRSVSPSGWLSAAIVLVAVGFVFAQLQPRLILSDTTPTGGDMGAHVWSGTYLRDHLLPDLRWSGWTPDWYGGFPAFQFYMVLPFMAIVLLDVFLPYGMAFKLVTVSGVVLMPAAAYAFGRLAGMRFPGPPLLAVATLPFLFDTGFTIYGGNIASTMAGEFAFSISLSASLVYLGLVARGLRTGGNRALAAAALAVTALCHLIPAIFALVGTVIWFALRPGKVQLHWLATVLPVGGALTAFWALPFWWQRSYLNDMGWEKITVYGENLWRGDNLWTSDLRWVFALAFIGLVVAIVERRRPALFLAASTVVWAVAFVVMPQGRLWNARLLPFYYLCLYLLAGYALSEIGRALARQFATEDGRPRRSVLAATPVAGLLATLVLVAMPLHALPLGSTDAQGHFNWFGLTAESRSFIDGWARWNYSGYEGKGPRADGGGYHEYHAVVTAMDEVGATNGCGRAMWEYEPELERYGTPMALMLLPHWTDGCIGSMEGLYFEAASSTPFHFLNQSELSVTPSRAQRDLLYGETDLDLGVQHLQLLGVRYYMAFSPEITDAAAEHPDLTEVARSDPWTVYEVSNAPLVEALDNQPAVLEGVGTAQGEWLEPAQDWYLDPTQWNVALAGDGPDEWERIGTEEAPATEPVPPATVSDIDTGDDRISFSVDRPGTPVLVKASYFPNWEVSGADGPYRVAPNLMVVIPTDTDVELTFGRTAVDYLGILVTILGLAGLVALARRPGLDVPEPPEPEARTEERSPEAPPGDDSLPDDSLPDDSLPDDSLPDDAQPDQPEAPEVPAAVP